MMKSRLLSLVLFVVCISCLLVGCAININIGNATENTAHEADRNLFFGTGSTMYKCSGKVYIGMKTAEDASISSSELKVTKSLMETYKAILQSDIIQDEIRKKYPGVEYTMELEQVNETEVLSIVAMGKDPTCLHEICNMALSLFCEKIPEIVEGVYCRVVDCAVQPESGK